MIELQTKMPRPLQRHVHRATFFREFHDVVSRHWEILGLPAEELLEIFSSSESPEGSLSRSLSTDLTTSQELSLTDIKRCDVTM